MTILAAGSQKPERGAVIPGPLCERIIPAPGREVLIPGPGRDALIPGRTPAGGGMPRPPLPDQGRRS